MHKVYATRKAKFFNFLYKKYLDRLKDLNIGEKKDIMEYSQGFQQYYHTLYAPQINNIRLERHQRKNILTLNCDKNYIRIQR